jgi:hypothetical protein
MVFERSEVAGLNQNNTEIHIKTLITQGMFSEVNSLLDKINNDDEALSTIIDIANSTENICVYTFIYLTIVTNPSAIHHTSAFSLLSLVFHFLWGL